ncbi:MAG TPA: ATP-binding protein [Thermoanaerobaculia bacterium]|nr:ATP-binding protein [Thermoanaerobaculia bacterium]
MSIPAARALPGGRGEALPLAQGLALLAPALLVGSEIGALLRYPDIGAAVLYPAYAVLTAVLVVSRRRDWIWYVLLAALAHFAAHWPHWPLSWVLFADLANSTRAVVAAVLLLRLLGPRPRLDGLRELALFIFAAVAVAPAVGATLGAANVMLHGAAAEYWQPWRAWFVSNALTGLTMLPAAMLTCEHAAGRGVRVDRRRAAEALALAGALIAACAVAFAMPSAYWPHLELIYAPLPVLIWAALRFGSGGASAALTLVAFAAIWATGLGTGPFVSAVSDANLYSLQTFLLLAAVPVLCLAATGAARRSVVELHHALLASVHDAVAILDSKGVVLEVNESWRRFAGSPEALPFQRVQEGDSFLAAVAAESQKGNATAASLTAGVTRVLERAEKRFEIDFDYDVGDRKRKWFSTSVEALERAAGGAVVTRADVTARREAQLLIEEQRRELSHLARVSVLGQLSGALAHELNQPLTAILSNAEAGQRLLERPPADLDEIAAILTDIADDDRRAGAVIQRLRALLERGEQRHQPILADELVAEVMGLARVELMTRQVTAVAEVAPGMPPVLGDKVQLQQVLLNLILNACDAMSASPVADRQLLLIAGIDGDGRARLAIRDRGTGIPAELMARLFEPFVTTKPQGLGLGLSLSRTIVNAHGGQLWAENNPEGGATVHCLLPTVAPSRQTAPAAHTPAAG